MVALLLAAVTVFWQKTLSVLKTRFKHWSEHFLSSLFLFTLQNSCVNAVGCDVIHGDTLPFVLYYRQTDRKSVV